jgi:phosphoribosylformimino-5-aminoimidazole carboxamide ribonucleotide (ProFAR) isomerase
LANTIHSADLKGGYKTKTEIFEVMVDLIAKRLSFEISEGIRHKKEAEKKALEEQNPQDTSNLSVVPNEEKGM